MQFADSVSVAKIKIIYASAHTQSQAHTHMKQLCI